VPVVWRLVRRKNIQTTKHVEACLEASRDGGSNPPASIAPTSPEKLSFFSGLLKGHGYSRN